MFKRVNKITSLLVAVAAAVSVMPVGVSAASTEKIKSENGEIYNAVAYKDGNFYISGKPSKKNDAAYYLSNGKYSELKDVNSEDKAEAYGTKYVEVNGGDNYVDLTSGKVSDEEIRNKNLDDVAVALRSKIKSDNDGRYDDSDAKNVHDITELPKAKFSEGWYSAEYEIKSVDESTNGGATNFSVYTDKSGKYIDADYNLGKIKVKLSNSKTATIENTSDSDDDVRGSVKDAKVIGQDSSNIYRLATITLKSTASDATIREVNGITLTDATDAYTLSSDKTSVSFEAIQVISKDQASKKVDGIKYARTVATYALADADGKKIDLLNEEDTSFTIADGKLVNYKINSDEVEAETIGLKYKSSDYYIEVKGDDKVKLQDGENSVDIDSEGNLWALSDDTIYKFDNNKDFEKAYNVDKEYTNISVYDKDNLVVWSSNDEIYSIVEKAATSDDADSTDTDANTNAGNTTTNNNANQTPTSNTVKAGWVQDLNGAWSYNNADGTKYKGWLSSGSNWYYIDDNAIMSTGWKLVNNKWYYLDKVSGAMHTGWLNDNGTWYYLNASGEMLTNTTVGSYKLGANGAWIK
ncbi:MULTISPECIES: cell wall-binding protein [unclassified Clostridium]|uniref:N-acetylmuramoyl-L-alanine amidase family protein n=1 Tax=unclassified Clostridium TaxID=2614128 RepID=UPI0002984AD1|nr:MULTISPECIES: cell wall-binding protein [unclassified Clostridium]EKQ50515.1 MAG: putative cell wall binding protein [Clostridium sp. Maddingley MBC34-26]